MDSAKAGTLAEGHMFTALEERVNEKGVTRVKFDRASPQSPVFGSTMLDSWCWVRIPQSCELRADLGVAFQGANKSPQRSGRRANLISGA